jgi:4,5-DOPA dioxygenase extradiol
MVALEENGFSHAMRAMGQRYSDASAVAIISAHWQRSGPVRVTAWEQAPIIHDFGGFPKELYSIEYPAPGSPDLAAEIAAALKSAGQESELDAHRGLDHGAWIPARLAWPEAQKPVVQVGLPSAEPRDLFALGRALRPFRERGVLLMGSGGIVHNLRRVRFAHEFGPVDPWAQEFDSWVAEQIEAGADETLFAYQDFAPHAESAVPTTEHFDPLFVILGTRFEGDRLSTIYEGFRYGNLSMRTFVLA